MKVVVDWSQPRTLVSAPSWRARRTLSHSSRSPTAQHSRPHTAHGAGAMRAVNAKQCLLERHALSNDGKAIAVISRSAKRPPSFLMRSNSE